MEKASSDPNSNPGAAADRIKDSAQQIWLAGLGAFAKMQQEGSKAFEALVKDGAGVQKKTQQAAEETLAQAQARMAGFANEFSNKAAGGWGKLENIFEERVARALEKLGVPSAREMAALQARVEALEAQLKQKQQPEPPKASASGTPRGSVPRKSPIASRKAAAARKAPAESPKPLRHRKSG